MRGGLVYIRGGLIYQVAIYMEKYMGENKGLSTANRGYLSTHLHMKK